MTVSEAGPVRVIAMGGTDFEAGRAYGEQAVAEIRLSITRYAAIFAAAGLGGWTDAIAAAARYEAAIARYAPGSLEQMRGIAAGAGLGLGDILALNTRSELMFGLSVTAAPLEDGCTSLTVTPERSGNGHALLAQNWDWTVSAGESLVLLARSGLAGAPGYVSLVEAGLLAKTGLNAAGLGLCTNTLVSTTDGPGSGVPYHVCLHQLLQAERVSDGLQFLYNVPRALSANYLLAHADGTALDIETGPGGPEAIGVLTAEDGVITHTNHFRVPALAVTDRRVRESAHTIVRLDRVTRRLAAAGPKLAVPDILDSLSDHANFPLSVCLHPDERKPVGQRFATLATVAYDLGSGEIWLSAGWPCDAAFSHLGREELLA
jgi:isopenicillin-N N-acyltransferase like protein